MDAASRVIVRNIGALESRRPRRFALIMRVTPIVEFIAAEPGMAARLLAEHVDDGAGRCRVCSSGAQAGRHIWPCALRGLAMQARELARDGR